MSLFAIADVIIKIDNANYDINILYCVNKEC